MRGSCLEDSTTPEDIRASVADKGGCPADDIRLGKITRSSRDGLGTCWIQVLSAAASKIIKSGQLVIGWTAVKIEALEARPLQCFKCMGVGHTHATCKSQIDRSGLCYRCGQGGHKAGECVEKLCCPYCKDHGHKPDHRYGGKACQYATSAKKGGARGKQRPAAKSNEGGKKMPKKPASTGAKVKRGGLEGESKSSST
ncbi:uncharacterized protein LOC114946188 [Nylanderia fulva]|uniref:uncharacterized protein LOC114931310 n=1 Tax=Nylanderia fulva TaxID=613905 RepID=UPI0010FB34C2|nr:uncharacterized protein LOC114931310 [Nylanderia fulva]XP_029178447.1 uncharacterized protein LOC114946188 [Nylanderia fulva]